MERVLLAIDGIFPDKGLLEYALSFSRRIRARLDVLHIVDPDIHGGTLNELQKQVGRARGFFEKTMMAAAFAESGEHETARALMDAASAQFNKLVSNENKEDVQYRVKIKSGGIDREIVDYVNGHKDIVLAIYDGTGPSPASKSESGKYRTAAFRSRAKTVSRQLQQHLPVPLVVRSGSDA